MGGATHSTLTNTHSTLRTSVLAGTIHVALAEVRRATASRTPAVRDEKLGTAERSRRVRRRDLVIYD